MIILIGVFFLISFVTVTSLLILCLAKNINFREAWQIITSGFKNGLTRGCGWYIPRHRYPVELYRWIPQEDGEVCDDCWERARWPPMDIADWMKEGLPGSREAETQCGTDCRCELVLVESKIPTLRLKP